MISRRNLIKTSVFGGAAPLAWQLAARAQAQVAGEIKPGVVFYFFPEGTNPDLFFPKAGVLEQLPSTSKPLAPWAPLITMIDGLSMYNETGNVGYFHETQHLSLAAGAPTSIDNVIAKNLMLDTPVPNLRIGVGNHWKDKVGTSRINGQGIVSEDNPLKLYARLFGQGPLAQDANLGVVKNTSGQAAAALVESQLDMLDGMQRAITRLPVPPLNLRGRFTQATDFSWIVLTERSVANIEALTDIQQDIAAMALALDLTRCVSFNIGHELWQASVIADNGLGHQEAGHAGRQEIAAQVTWHMHRYARFLGKLAALPGPAGNLLQSTFCLSYSNMGTASYDFNGRMPFVLGGGQAFGHKGGRVLDYRPQAAKGLPHAQLYTGLAQKMGLDIQEFGAVSTFNNLGGGPLPGLWG